MTQDFDLIIVGGGPAGLSAALIAGRARRRALLLDAGPPRNAAAPAMHSFVSRDGILPKEFRASCHAELKRYPTVERQSQRVAGLTPTAHGFVVSGVDGQTWGARHVLLALGMEDRLPDLAGLADNWGKGVHHCPFCDGFEHSDGAWGVLADTPAMLEHTAFYRNWTQDLTVFTQGQPLPDPLPDALRGLPLRFVTEPIAEVLDGNGHAIGGVRLRDGQTVPIGSLWVRPEQRQTELVRSLSLTLRDDGAIWRDAMGQTSLPGLYAAGDCAAGPMQQAILAAADGARSAFGIIHALLQRPA